jgi:hypothetical protein
MFNIQEQSLKSSIQNVSKIYHSFIQEEYEDMPVV